MCRGWESLRVPKQERDTCRSASTRNLSATRVEDRWKVDSEAETRAPDATEVRPDTYLTCRRQGGEWTESTLESQTHLLTPSPDPPGSIPLASPLPGGACFPTFVTRELDRQGAEDLRPT